jgi:hypothetical protein
MWMAVRYATLRASDADRDAVADRLRRAAIEGRLDPDELDERLAVALSAKTYGELDPLLADLPGAPATPRPIRQAQAFTPRPRRTAPAGIAFAVALRVAFVLAVICVLAVAVAATVAWWILVALIWLVAHGSRGCNSRRRPAFQRRPIV